MGQSSKEKHVEIQGNQQHAISICEVNQAQLASMEEKIVTKPTLLSNSAGQSSCCIFRIPPSQIQVDRHAYHPHIISIGPFHYGKEPLKMIQEHKWRFLGTLVARTRSKGLSLEDYMKAIKPLEDEARQCYSEIIYLNSDEFIEMLVLDGCFIIEIFRIVGKVVQTDPNDPIFAMSWVFPFLLRDFVKLENQIPFFILRTLFHLSKMPEEESGPSLVTLVLKSFDTVMERTNEVIQQYDLLNIQHEMHLLDLLRLSFIPRNRLQRPPNPNASTQMIRSVSKLIRAGIKFQVGTSYSFLDVNYKDGVIEMPTVTIDDFTSPFFLNCVAFEQCYNHCPKSFTTYATLMDSLVNTSKDVEYLSDAGIIDNYFSTDAEVSRFFNIMGKDVSFDILRCYLAELFDDVNEYYSNNWNVQWASFKYTYFNTPWSFISALAAVILLILTVAQTFYTVYPFYRS